MDFADEILAHTQKFDEGQELLVDKQREFLVEFYQLIEKKIKLLREKDALKKHVSEPKYINETTQTQKRMQFTIYDVDVDIIAPKFIALDSEDPAFRNHYTTRIYITPIENLCVISIVGDRYFTTGQIGRWSGSIKSTEYLESVTKHLLREIFLARQYTWTGFSQIEIENIGKLREIGFAPEVI